MTSKDPSHDLAWPVLGMKKFQWPTLLVSLWGLAFLVAPLMAQLEPCGNFEADGKSGYTAADWFLAVRKWPQIGTQPTFPDYDGDGIVTVKDLIIQSNCVPDLSHGLLGTFYGFEDGSPGQNITFPDFSNLGPGVLPTVMQAVPQLERLDGFGGFMDSDMRKQFGATFDGYLFVPETANYTLHIYAVEGLRMYLDGNKVLEVDTNPEHDDVTLPLEYGLHPVYLEFFTDASSSRILLDWSSNGTVIGSTATTIPVNYFYHQSGQPHETSVSELGLVVSPDNGTATSQTSIIIATRPLGARSDLRMWVNGQEKLLIDGFYQQGYSLDPGLNHFEIQVTDGAGRQKTFDHYIYRRENATTSGLAATGYATEWYDSPMPKPEENGLRAFVTATSLGTQLSQNAQGQVNLSGTYLGEGTVLHLEGEIQLDFGGTYTFRISETGGLKINGVLVAGINYSYADQWMPDGDIWLAAGRHHYQLDVSDPWSGPDMDVWYRLNGGPESLIPNSAFTHNQGHYGPVPVLLSHGSGARISSGLVAEYMFKNAKPYEDTAGNRYHLWPDSRPIMRTGGGATFQTGGVLSSEQAGIRMVREAVRNNAFTLEADFMYDAPDTNNWDRRDVVSLTSATWEDLARITVRNDMIAFIIRDEDGQSHTLEVDNAIVPGTRYHVAGRWTGTRMEMSINTVNHVLNESFSLTRWPYLAQVNIGKHFNRVAGPSVSIRTAPVTVLAAAFYNRALTLGEANINRAANISLTPTPGALSPASPVTFPPPGTSAAQLDEAHHILNRMTFGPDVTSLNQILTMGVSNWIAQQLDPESINDDVMEAYMSSGFLRPDFVEADIRAGAIARMTLSKRQLAEVMAWFWENHFSTQSDKVRSANQEWAENQRFHDLALGSFKDLLLASATHFPMTVYLDSDSNVVGAQNENYAREILELHTHGVNNGYTQADIVEAARCFTGWTVDDGLFTFNPGLHDYGEKTLLGITIPAGGGLSDGLTLIDHIVSRPQTADFISWKLCQVFIDDDPPADVVSAASTTFQNTGGDIKQVLQTILNHARFRSDLTYRGNKVRTPWNM